MNDDDLTKVENDNCFINIFEGYEDWCRDKVPGGNWLALTIMAFFAATSIILSWIYHDLFPLAAGGFLSMVGYAVFSKDTEWPPVIDEYLNDYQPVNIDAFTAFQAAVKADGELRKETLGKWVEVERRARLQRPCRSSGSTFTGRDITSTGNQAGR
ncbi:hypothetical protein [Phytobacter sp. AG2a]